MATSRSTRDPINPEYEMCGSCHSRESRAAQDPTDIDGLLDPRSASFHPVKAVARGTSPSARTVVNGADMSCSTCHGSDSESGVGGPHGSNVQFILRAPYSTLDGNEESERTYGLCYSCHDRDAVLQSQNFPEHRRHVVDLKTSCATCHNPHGSYTDRAMIRFEDDATLAAVAPSLAIDRLAFESSAPGSGLCYLTCHGFDHAPAGYGAEAAMRGGAVDPRLESRRGVRTRSSRERSRSNRDRSR